ncbi:hypothetical protein GCM10011351_23300 [Paraliobacillus quinghaiensis]|uniref:NusG domain-containing protein n=1 Tax=Paraliobacillus quinghaiensis TaxID=470815 RepID=A0A917TUA8_9BACI|nr:NusG domain II-containing protein [Paraliobacillus quinghaiensis]GGM36533.1 hypothetical protein GCM10011351_23300 [Paraliobacillus quinghaiensis]
MKAFLRVLKTGDLVIITVLISVSFLPFAVFYMQQSQNTNTDHEAVISVDNEEVKHITLTEHEGTDVFDISKFEDEINTIEVVDGRIRIKSATCPDQVCVRTGYISEPGETIVCLPHKLIVEVHTTNEDTEADIISS